MNNLMNLSLKKYEDSMLLLMRLVVAFVFLWHGVPKAIDPALAMSKFTAMGFPAFLGPIVGWAEVILGVFVLIGFWNTWSNLILGFIIIVAIVGVQMKAGDVTAGLERDLLLVAGNLVLAATGPGKFSFTGKKK